MIAEFLAIGLLLYLIVVVISWVAPKEKFDKIVYHSKVTRIIFQIISIVGSVVIIVSLISFISLMILGFIQSGLFKETVVKVGWDDNPTLLFLSVIGSFVLVYFPIFLSRFLPYFGEKEEETKIVPAGRDETMKIVEDLKKKNPETMKLLGK